VSGALARAGQHSCHAHHRDRPVVRQRPNAGALAQPLAIAITQHGPKEQGKGASHAGPKPVALLSPVASSFTTSKASKLDEGQGPL